MSTTGKPVGWSVDISNQTLFDLLISFRFNQLAYEFDRKMYGNHSKVVIPRQQLFDAL